MPNNLTPEDRKRTMRAVKSSKTRPERRLRAYLAGRGISGWKMHPQDAFGNPDFSFQDLKIAIFVDGCFWHACPHCNRPMPETNIYYWSRKIKRNVERDELVTRELINEGWRVIRIWEHQLKTGRDLQKIGELLNRTSYSQETPCVIQLQED